MMQKQHRLYAIKIKNPENQKHVAKHKKAKTNLKKEIQKTKRKYFDNQFKINENNKQKTWCIIKQILGQQKSMCQSPKIIKTENTTITDDYGKSQAFNKYFTTIAEKLVAKLKTLVAKLKTTE
ncbi:MAG: hypothetical protein ACK55I_13530, partial [bacterium]